MNERAPLPRPRLEGPSRRFRKATRRLARSERGTAVVEFALVAPLLFFLVFGIIEFGRILNAYNDLTQLAGQGARAAAVNRNPDGTAVSATGTVDSTCDGQNYSIQCQLSSYYAKQDSLSGVSVCIVNPNDPNQISIGDPVTVQTTYQYQFLTGLFGFGHITLHSSQTERAEATPSYATGVDQTGSTCK